MSALRVHHCACDPSVIPGVPGQACTNCGAVRVVPMSRDDALRLNDEVRVLRQAAGIVEALSGSEDVTGEHARALIGDAQILIGEATRGLTAAYDALAPTHEEGRPTTGMAGARDQDPGRSQ